MSKGCGQKTLSARSSPFFGKWIHPPGTVVIRLTKNGSTGTKQINSTSIHILNKKNETGSAFTTTYCMQLIFLLLEMNFKKINKQSYKVICIVIAISVRILHWITVHFNASCHISSLNILSYVTNINSQQLSYFHFFNYDSPKASLILVKCLMARSSGRWKLYSFNRSKCSVASLIPKKIDKAVFTGINVALRSIKGICDMMTVSQ